MVHEAVIVGAGQIACAAWDQFWIEGYEDIRICARSQPPWVGERGVVDCFDHYTVGQSPAPEAEIVLDTIAFDEEDVLRYDPDKIGHLVLISSASVYCDAQGRSLDEAAKNGWPDFDGPIRESNPTVRPGPATYSTRKVRMEEKARELFGDRVTILRPGAIHGPHSRHPREWWFVKRMLDGRSQIPLMLNGQSQFQTTCVRELAWYAVRLPKRGVAGTFNVADDPAPSVLEIGRSIARHMNCAPDFELLDQEDSVGRTPWSVAKPLILNCEKVLQGQASRDYNQESEHAVRWLRDLNPSDWRAAFPQLAAYPWDLFDYEAEDRFFASQ